MKKALSILIVLTIFFTIDVNASSAHCVYVNDDEGYLYSIDINENYEINDAFTKIGGFSPDYNLNATITNNFIEDQKLYCPPVIYGVMNKSGNNMGLYTINQNGVTTTLLLDEDESIVYNSDNIVNEPTIIRECPYGDMLVIYIMSDGSVTAYKPGYEVTIYDPNNKFIQSDECPSISINSGTRNGEKYTDIYTEDQGEGYSKPEYNPNKDIGQKNKIIIPIIDVPEIKFCEEARVLQAFKIAGIVLLIVKILVPLLIIVLGTIDFTKALIDSGDKANKEALNMLVKRLIIGIIIFMIPTILDIVLSFVDGAVSTSETFSVCTHCLFNPNDCNK